MHPLPLLPLSLHSPLSIHLILLHFPSPPPDSQLLWTAPELLRNGVSHLDHVGSGTLEGDMYSLAIIMVEMLTYDMPFSDLMNYIDIADVLRAVAGVKNVSSQLPQVLSVYNSGKCLTRVFTPSILPLHRPGAVTQTCPLTKNLCALSCLKTPTNL